MTNLQKAAMALAIVMDAFDMPENFTLGDVCHALAIVDPDDEIIDMIKPLIRDAVIDEIKKNIAIETICGGSGWDSDWLRPSPLQWPSF